MIKEQYLKPSFTFTSTYTFFLHKSDLLNLFITIKDSYKIFKKFHVLQKDKNKC